MKNSALELSADVSASIAIAHDLLADAARIEDALDRQVLIVADARKTRDATAALRVELEADQALTIDDTEARALDARIKKAVASATAAQSELEHSERLEGALRARLARAVADIEAEAAVMTAVASQHAQDVVEMLSGELVRAAAPLLAALRRAAVFQTAIYSRELSLALLETVIANPGHFPEKIVQGLFAFSEGRRFDLTDGWQGDADLVADHAVLSDPRLMATQLAEFSTRAARERAAIHVPVKRGYTIESRGARVGK